MNDLYIKRPSSAFNAEISLPASKSISNRLLIVQYLSGNKIRIENLSEADDTALMQALIKKINQHMLDGLPERFCELDCYNAGTVFRFLTAALSIQPGTWYLTGSERMKQRPVLTLCNALESLGASIQYLEKRGYPPIKIQGRPLKGGSVILDASQSSQYVSAILMIAPLLEGGLQIELAPEPASRPYIDMTLALMLKAGIKIHSDEHLITVEQGSYNDSSFIVEPDWSSASYWYETLALMPGSEVLLKGLSFNSLQGDAVLADVFGFLGIGSYTSERGIIIRRINEPEPVFSFNFSNYPDIVPALAATCAALNIEANLNNLKNLRIKESNRLEALRAELVKINPQVAVIGNDLLQIRKREITKSRQIIRFNTYNDHRMAMALAPLAVTCEGLVVENPQLVAKSYPTFWDDFRKVGFHVEENL